MKWKENFDDKYQVKSNWSMKPSSRNFKILMDNSSRYKEVNGKPIPYPMLPKPSPIVRVFWQSWPCQKSANGASVSNANAPVSFCTNWNPTSVELNHWIVPLLFHSSICCDMSLKKSSKNFLSIAIKKFCKFSLIRNSFAIIDKKFICNYW